jgi:2-dehydro-3-deoxyphosphogluconate aldolase/(4S)-4-hydroxy-2-oxoglutarate aldolase
VLEVTLRTSIALDAIRRMASVPGAIVGAGTVLNGRQLDEAVEAGAKFLVSPGLTEPLAKAAERSGAAYLPGVATAGDIMRGLDLGLDRFKFFPAEASGGISALKALSGPFGAIRFCPTGGVRPDNAAEWLAMEAVLCVGGTWLYRAGDNLNEVSERARAASSLRH